MIPKLNDPRISEHEGILVVRDDDLPGGTKRRVLATFMHRSMEFVYASPAQGFAQIALAYACREAGKFATIFVAKRSQLHPRTLEARAAGAKIVQVAPGYLTNVQAKARGYCELTGAYLLPFGFDNDEIREGLAGVARSLKIQPKEVWSVAGSGTLTRALQTVWKDAEFYAVQIGRAPDVGRAKLIQAPEAFEKDAQIKPPFPSCSNYDAKAWRFIREKASPGALFWNVAG